MPWFKNAIIYQINDATLLNKETLEKAVLATLFTPCSHFDLTRAGWVSPYGDNELDSYIIDLDGHLLLRLKKETKILPSHVINDALKNKIEQDEAELNRRLSKKEKQNIKDNLMTELLPRAFSKFRHIWLWIDTKNNKIIIDSASFKLAEEVLTILRKELGSLSITPLNSPIPFEKTLTSWIENNVKYPHFTASDEIELKDSLDTKQLVRCKNQDVFSNEILTHIESGKLVHQLKIADDRGFDLVLTSNITLKKIKFTDDIKNENHLFLVEEYKQKLDADFLIITHLLSDFIEELSQILIIK